jgi:hypothetical protein
MKLVSIKNATDGKHKMTAIFDNDGKNKTIQFGAKGYNDYTIYYKKDKKLAEEKKQSYIARHDVNENFNKPDSAGALSRWILWNKPSVDSSIKDFKKKFKL